MSRVSVTSAEPLVGPRDALNVLNDARGSMLTLFNMYVTGIGIILAIWATAEDSSVRVTLSLAAIPFMIVNLAGFVSNLRVQSVVHRLLNRTAPSDAEAYELVGILKPISAGWFISIYVVACAGLVTLGIILAPLLPIAKKG